MYKTNVLYWPFLFLIDGIGYLLIAPFVKWGNISRISHVKKIKKILLIRIEEIGDMVLTTPFIRELKRNLKEAEIHVLCKQSTRTLLDNNPHVDKVLVCKKSWLDTRIGGSFDSFFPLVRLLRKERYDLAFDLHPDPQNILLAFLVSQYALGFGYRGFGFLLTRAAGWKRLHIIKQNLSLLSLLVLKAKDEKTEFYFSKKDERAINLLMKNDKTKKFVCVHPGTRRNEKRWPVANWVALCDRLLKRRVTVVLTGSAEENAYNENIIKKVAGKGSIINVAGKTSLTEFGCLVKRSVLFIGPDTGAMHIARAVGTPLIGLFASEDPGIWGYTERKYQSVYAKKMSDIRMDDVMGAGKDILP